MRSIYFGRIESLPIRSGEPDLSGPLRIVREIKFGAENALRPDLAQRDYYLKVQVVEMFAEFDRLVDHTVLSLEVKNGLPYRILVSESGS